MSRHTPSPSSSMSPGPGPSPGSASSRLSDEVLHRFLHKPLTGELTEVPQLGRTAAATLRRGGCLNTYQLVGHYLALRRRGDSREAHDAKFKAFLDERGCPKGHSGDVAYALSCKLAQRRQQSPSGAATATAAAAVRLDIRLTRAQSLLSDDQRARQVRAALTGELAADLLGVGAVAAGKMAAKGVTSTWQVAGQLLQRYDPAQPAAGVAAFMSWLGAVGVRNRNYVLQQLADRLAGHGAGLGFGVEAGAGAGAGIGARRPFGSPLLSPQPLAPVREAAGGEGGCEGAPPSPPPSTPRTPKLRPKRAAGAEVAGTGKAAARAESGALRGYIVASMLVLLLALWMHANLTHLGLLVGSGACVSAGVWPSKAPASAHAPVRTRTSPK